MGNVTAGNLLNATLKALEYGGLFDARVGCSCCLDDLVPCKSSPLHCEAGYIVNPKDHPYGFQIVPEKPDPDLKVKN